MVSKSWIKKLFNEIKQWVSDGIIDSSQEARIKSHYAGRLEYGRLINTITTLGSILVGLGVLLFVASNWDKLGRAVKITIIFSVTSLFNLAGYYFRNVKKNHPGLSQGFFLMGAFSFGAGIWLIAQIYQIHYNFSGGILFWILGILPLVYIYRLWTVLSLSSILSFIWLCSYQSYYFQRAGYGFFILLAVILFFCYKQGQRFPLFVMIAAVASWLGHFWFLEFYRAELFSEANAIIAHLVFAIVFIALGFILYALGVYHLARKQFGKFSFLYKFLGIIFICLPAYSLSFAHHYDDYTRGVYPLKVGLVIGFLFILAISISLYLRNLSRKEGRNSQEINLVLCVICATIFAVAVSLMLPRFTSLCFNIILFIETLGFMYLGFIKHSEGIFRLSIVIFFVNVLSRYFDIFWKMMPRSLLFIFGGIILIAGAIFADSKRRQIEERMHEG